MRSPLWVNNILSDSDTDSLVFPVSQVARIQRSHCHSPGAQVRLLIREDYSFLLPHQQQEHFLARTRREGRQELQPHSPIVSEIQWQQGPIGYPPPSELMMRGPIKKSGL